MPSGAPPAEDRALPMEAQRAVSRHAVAIPNHRPGAEKGQMANTEVGTTVRTPLPSGSLVEQPRRQAQVSPPSMRTTSRGGVPRQSGRLRAGAGKPGLEGHYVAELFAGSGRVAAAVRRQGVVARTWEIHDDPDRQDLTLPAVRRRILTDATQRRLVSAMIAPPCSSWGTASFRTEVLRSREDPWGLASLTQPAQMRVNMGNEQMRAAIALIHGFEESQTAWTMEHPASSFFFKTATFAELSRLDHIHTRRVDQCQFGGSAKKPTVFIFSRFDPLDTAVLDKQCSGRTGICSRSKKRHIRLEGRKTSEAAAYPHNLAERLARILVDPALGLVMARMRF